MAVLPDLTSMSHDQLRALVMQMHSKVDSNGLKVTEKGAVSMYGLGRFPVTLYYSQWVKLIERVDGLKAFLEANKSKLSIKTTTE
jgi:hypothetical protein